MDKKIQYFRIIDLSILTIFSILSMLAGSGLIEIMNATEFRVHFGLLISIVAYVRWGKISFFIYPVTLCLDAIWFQEGIEYVYVAMIQGLSIMLGFILVSGIDREKYKKSFGRLSILIVVCYLVTQVSAGLTAFAIDGEGFSAGYFIRVSFATNLLVLFATIGVSYMLTRISDIFVDIEKYFLRIWSEEKDEQKQYKRIQDR